MKLAQFYSVEMLKSLVIIKQSTLERKLLVCYRDNNKYLGFIEYCKVNDAFFSYDLSGNYRMHSSDKHAIIKLVFADLVREMKEETL